MLCSESSSTQHRLRITALSPCNPCTRTPADFKLVGAEKLPKEGPALILGPHTVSVFAAVPCRSAGEVASVQVLHARQFDQLWYPLLNSNTPSSLTIKMCCSVSQYRHPDWGVRGRRVRSEGCQGTCAQNCPAVCSIPALSGLVSVSSPQVAAYTAHRT